MRDEENASQSDLRREVSLFGALAWLLLVQLVSFLGCCVF